MGRSNPLRWNCSVHGCFNVKRRPKIELFSKFLPGDTSFGDVDALHEYRGRYIALEWKHYTDTQLPPIRVPEGQNRTFCALTRELRGRFLWIVCAGDAETMEIHWHKRIYNGGASWWERSSFDVVGLMIQDHWKVRSLPQSLPHSAT